MKRLNRILTVLAFAVLGLSLKAAGQMQISIPGIEGADIEVWKGNSGPVKLTDPAGKVVQKFGAPGSSEPYEFEMFEKTGKLIKYGTNEFYEMDNKFYSFGITNNQYKVGFNGKYIQVGDHINKVTTMYAQASSFKDSNSFYIPLLVNGGPDDGVFLVVSFDPSIWIITSISKYEQ